MISLARIFQSSLLLLILHGCAGGGDTAADTTSSTTNNNNTSTASQANYTTADLNGCFQPVNSGFLEYYCFDGVGGYYREMWTPISGCSGILDSGNYVVQGTKLTVCDQSGCSEYSVQPTSDGMVLDGTDAYSSSAPCS